MVDRIQLVAGVHDDFKNYIADEDNEPICYFDLHDINILVGANNSGKSRFIRAFLKTDRFLFADTLIWLKQILIDSVKLRSNYKQFFEANEQRELQDMIGNIERTIEFLKHQIHQDLNRVRELWSNQNSNPYRHTNLSISTFDRSTEDETAIKRLLQNINEKQSLISSFVSFKPTEISKKTYIPILRSAVSLRYDLVEENRSLSYAQSDIFEKTIQSNYGLPIHAEASIITGLDFHRQILVDRNTTRIRRENFVKFQEFLSTTFFNSKEIEIIGDLSSVETKTKERPDLIKICISGEERPIHDLGDGIQSLIILLYPVFMAEENTWIFIEEPEMNLHPAFQRIFLETISNHKDIKDKKLKFFFTTHSNHLLDLSFEQGDSKIAMYQFEKSSEKIEDSSEPKFRIRKTEPKDIALLNCLGIHNSSVFLANCSIWVEGITDRLYLQAYLEAYYNSEDFITKKKTKYLEDIHFAFFVYGGNNLDYYFPQQENIEIDKATIEPTSLSTRIFVTADGDQKNKLEGILQNFFDNNSQKFGWHIIPGKAIESTISKEVYQIALQSLSQGKQIDELIDSFDFEKHENSKEDLIIALKKHLNGTMQFSKRSLAKSVYDNKANLKWEDLTQSARNLAKEVYNFIEKHNSH